MKLSTKQKDALMEIINIGFGQAARSLGRMVNRQVLLDAPYVDIIPINELEGALSELAESSLLTVHQLFSGELSGDMILLFDTFSAPRLATLFSQGQNLEDMEDSASSVIEDLDYIDPLTELGNIMLGAFASSFGNLLHIQIRFSVPEMHKLSLLSMLETIKIGEEEMRYAVIVRIYFRLIEEEIQSRMLIVMGIDSLESLFKAIKAEGFLAS
jgi:chemotaxis protein CheC